MIALKYSLGINPSSFPLAINMSIKGSESVADRHKNHSIRDCPSALPTFSADWMTMFKLRSLSGELLTLTTAVEGVTPLVHVKRRYMAVPSMPEISSMSRSCIVIPLTLVRSRGSHNFFFHTHFKTPYHDSRATPATRTTPSRLRRH